MEAANQKKQPGTFAATDAVANAYRRWGYLAAALDDLGRLEPFVHEELAEARRSASDDVRAALERTYCGSIGVEFMHIVDAKRVRWVTNWLEAERETPDRERILQQLAQSELFERFLHARYVGSKRYSIEGVAGIIPLVESILDAFADSGGQYAAIAMSHRGRLNVLANIVGIAGREIFAGQEDVNPASVLGSGDVKYHLGATGLHETRSGKAVKIHLVSNPSHLEAVDPVVAGRVRAKQDRIGPDGEKKILSLTMHGDAAFAGQGITAETLNMAGLVGYSIGGTIHLIVNNLIGFTAEPPQLHTSRFSADLGRRLDVPIIHVNGEDPDTLVAAGRLAFEYKTTFGDDVIVDIIGYRRYGHSEVEDPSTTQPLLYQKIKDRPMLWQLYADRIGESATNLETLRERLWQKLEVEQEEGRTLDYRPRMRTMPDYWNAYRGGSFDAELPVETAVPRSILDTIVQRIAHVPDGFSIHPKIKRGYENRLKMVAGEKRVDFGMAETLAYGALLLDGMPVRLSGEDSRRGTFNQRQAVLVDVENGTVYTPLANLAPDQGRFTVLDSPLSEAAALGYEYGYSRDYPDALVLWEAQFGDFVNGAQTIIDQFISAGEDKWGLLSGLVMLLPHGYEGQGPEHSSARIERFLQLAAEDNILICQPTTAAQYFHMLRRQALTEVRKPLVVFTPKSMLRAEAAASDISAFTEGSRFRTILGEDTVDNAGRVLLCNGKIYHELRKQRQQRNDTTTAIVSIDQLYPFPEHAFENEMARHTNARKVIWVQEEPANMGALQYVRPILQRLLGDRQFTTVKRSASASPATGSAKAHGIEQQALINLAFA